MQGRKNQLKIYRFLVKVRSFLRFKRKKELLTFLFFVILSTFFWFLQLMKENLETDFRVPLRIINIPRNIILTSDIPNSLQVRAKDKGATLFSYSFSRPVPTCEIDFRELQIKKGVATISSDYLLNKLRKKFVVGIDLRSVFPESINLNFSQGESKTVPVKLLSAITTENSFGLSNRIRFWPPKITIYAPTDKLNQIKEVYTQVLRVSNLKDTFETNLVLNKIDGVKLVPYKIRVMVPVESITEKSIDIPVIGINVPEGFNMRLFPATIRVVCSVSISHYKSVQANDFSFVIDYNDIQKNNTGRHHIKMVKYPHYVSNIRYQPDEVDVLMEEIQND
ncbi:MAG: YbbR-like domain-containing protein [Bacteroidota bacterium]|uniref:CdaR family protein n=1 Tax=Parabacteroides sp. FAFU027 TaxID=2922715 RepID=UPI001FAE805C|nr:YbbR-like domain-containing protein [Parabacteroides sp. FAFU027]MDP4270422.1 YbbR-like domain-containing protein [Bacteroidota bacterium]